MQRSRFIAFASVYVALFSFLSVSQAQDPARVYYQDGTRIETKDFDMRINLEIQPRFTYEDNDQGGREEAGILSDSEDIDSFDLRRVRAIFSGNLLNKRFSYKVEHDFRDNDGKGELKDAWLQWNSEQAHGRFGQFKVPFSRQENVDSSSLQFIDRSVTNEVFAPGRHMGAMVHGALSDSTGYFLGAFNGESTEEGIDRGGEDNNLAVDAAVTADFGSYGSRAFEGDLRDDKSSTAFTSGLALIYGEGENNLLTGDVAQDFKRFDLNADAGMRSNGLSVQTEFYYSNIDVDEAAVDGDVFGFYVQSGYMLDENWEPAARFSYVKSEDDLGPINDIDEFNVVLNYYIKGHLLKVQTGLTFVLTSFDADAEEEDNLSDFRFETQLSGYF